jgi:hypothetical protein
MGAEMTELEPLWVVGNEHYGATFANRKLNGTSISAVLIRDTGNQFDKNAIGVHTGGKQVGYLSSARAEKIVRWIDASGGHFETHLQYRDGGADVFVPAEWVAKDERLNVQQTTKYQAQLLALGAGEHTCHVVASGEQLDVVVDDVVVGRLYPKQIDAAMVVRLQDGAQRLEIAASEFREGVFARVIVAAPKAPRAAKSAPAMPAPVKSPAPAPETGVKGFLKGLFSR